MGVDRSEANWPCCRSRWRRPGALGRGEVGVQHRLPPAAGLRSYKCGFKATAPGIKSDLLPETIASPQGSVPPPLFISRRPLLRSCGSSTRAAFPFSRGLSAFLPQGLCPRSFLSGFFSFPLPPTPPLGCHPRGSTRGP